MTWTSSYQLLIAVMTSFGGGAIIVWLMSSWLGRVWAERILESSKERYGRELEGLKSDYSRDLEILRASNDRVAKSVQAELDKNIYITKAHFDVELQTLKLLWKRMNALHLAIIPLRPSFCLEPAGESAEERRERRDSELSKNMETGSDAHNAALSAVEDQRPFYPRSIFASATEALGIARLELGMIRTNTERYSINWYLDGKRNREEYASKMFELEQGIRDRIEKLSIRA